MDLKKAYRLIIVGFFFLMSVSVFMVGFLNAQEYFPRGVFGLDNPNNLNTNNAEMQLIYGTYSNYLFGVINDAPSVMIFCRDTTNGAIKMNIERDPNLRIVCFSSS